MNTFNRLEELLGQEKIQADISLARYTTLKVGGSAQYFYVARKKEEVADAYKAARKLEIAFTVLGGGSNILISDKGIKGLVVKNESNSIEIIKRIGKYKKGTLQTEQALIEADTGALINQLVRFCCDEGLAGLERHLGLPGTVGGALYMNSKWTQPVSYVGDVLYQAKVLDKNGNVKVVDQKYFNFGYDQSILQKSQETVLSATFLLKYEDSSILWKRAHQSMAYRKESQPMGVASAGCTFRNISIADAMRVATPNHTTSAGYLIDQVGLKGYTVGGAQISDKHANFILNKAGAKAQDIKDLIDKATQKVKDKFNIIIKPEIVLLGEFN